MYRYIAFSWNKNNASASSRVQRLCRRLVSSAAGWNCALESPGLSVYEARHSGGALQAYRLSDRSGVVVGRLFRKADEGNQKLGSGKTFDEVETRRLLSSEGRHLIGSYWGQYVAFLRTDDGHCRYVLRDPTGALPCYIMRQGDVDIVLSDMEDYVRLDLGPFTVNWDHVSASLIYRRLVTSTTGLNEVGQLYAGACRVFKDRGERTETTESFYWSPVEVAESNTVEDPIAAAEALYSVIVNCVKAWGSAYDSILHELSGGLDSSIVAACLAKVEQRPKVLCFHYFTEAIDGDERQYARAVARHVDLELLERPLRVSDRTLERQLDKSRRASPVQLGLLPSSELLKRRIVADRHVGAVFSGQGGDHLFQQVRSIRFAAEYVYRNGLGGKLMSVLADTTKLTGHSIWSVLGAVIRYGVLRRAFDPYADFEAPAILSHSAREGTNLDSFRHPWVIAARRLPAIKTSHVFLLVDTQGFYDVPRPYVEQVHPLISQPIIELSLQIPSYILAYRGRTRGLVRDAFESELPKSIIHRKDKGVTSSYFNRLMTENVGYIREILLDGVLVSEGILDKDVLESQLSEQSLVSGTNLRPIFSAIKTEVWLDSWSNVRRRSAA